MPDLASSCPERTMNIEGSYDLASFAIDSRGEIRRLKAQLDLFWEQESALLRRLGLRDGLRVLDVGCGPGQLIHRVAAEFPGCACAGVEIDPLLLEVATETAKENGLHNCLFHGQSACEMQLPDESFDFVIMRLVLEHLPNPELALKEVLRVLAPGGTGVFIDNDFDLHERTFPDCPSLDELYDAYKEARRAEGGNPCIGRQLPLLLSEAGFRPVALDMVAAHSQITGDEAFLRAEGAGIPAQLVKTGFLKPDALERITNEWANMLGHEHHSIFRTLFVASGRKPPAGTNPVSSSRGGEAEKAELPTSRLTPDSGNGKPARPEDLKEVMRQVLEEEMGLSPNSLSTKEPLVEAGVDSIAALRLCNRIKSEYAATIKIADVISGKSIDDLAQAVLQQLESGKAQTLASAQITLQPRTQSGRDVQVVP